MFECERCHETFSTKQNLTNHMNKKNKCFVDGIIKCHLCGQKFDRRDNLTRHLNRKTKCCNMDNEEMRKMIEEQVKEEVKKMIKESGIINSSNHTTNNINNTTNNINNTYMINYVTNNYPSAKNLEDCVNFEHVTKPMIEECKDLYFIDGSIYLIQELIGNEEDKRPLHCTDPSRNNYIYKTKGNWKIDVGGFEIKSQIMPVIKKAYEVVHTEKRLELPVEKQFYYHANVRGKDMMSDNVEKVYTKAMNSIKTSCLAKNNKDLRESTLRVE